MTYFLLDLAYDSNFNNFVTGFQTRVFYESPALLSGLPLSDTQYFGRIRKVADNNRKSNWTYFNFTTESGIVIPDTPGNLAVSNVTDIGATINWDSVVDADSYNLYILNTDTNLYLDENTNESALPIVYKNTASTSIPALNLSIGTNYSAFISAVNMGGESVLSSPVNFATYNYKISTLEVLYKYNNNVNDSSGNGNNGTLLGGASVSSNYLNIGNNSTDALRIPISVLNGKTNHSFCTWIKLNGINTNPTVLSAFGTIGELTVAYLSASNIWRWFVNGVFVSFLANSTIESLNWVHFAYTMSSTEAKLYINGVLIDTKSVTWSAFSIGTNGLILGQDQDSLAGGFQATQSLNGRLKNTFIYSSILTAEEVNECMNLPLENVIL
jgi:hypothetical protein